METLFLIGYYISYFIIGIGWTIYVHGIIEEDPKYQEGYYFEIALASNLIFWPICMLAHAYAKAFLKRDTLFENKED